MIKVISLWQPWASWIALGWKTIETRTHTRFFGLVGDTIGIHAAERFDNDAVGLAIEANAWDEEKQKIHSTYSYPKGCIIATALVTNVLKLNPVDSIMKKAMIETYSQRYGLFLDEIKSLKNPIVIKGKQGIWWAEVKQ